MPVIFGIGARPHSDGAARGSLPLHGMRFTQSPTETIDLRIDDCMKTVPEDDRSVTYAG
jgi:hypothetical protein